MRANALVVNAKLVPSAPDSVQYVQCQGRDRGEEPRVQKTLPEAALRGAGVGFLRVVSKRQRETALFNQ